MIAQVVRQGAPWSFVEIAITLVIVLAVCGLVAIFARVAGFNFPPWVWHVIGIVVAAVVIILAIRFVAGA
jgi:hypothetical protein